MFHKSDANRARSSHRLDPKASWCLIGLFAARWDRRLLGWRSHQPTPAPSPSTPRREFLYVDDMARASVHVMNLPKATYDAHTQPIQSLINVGYGTDITIAQLAQAVSQAAGYEGKIN